MFGNLILLFCLAVVCFSPVVVLSQTAVESCVCGLKWQNGTVIKSLTCGEELDAGRLKMEAYSCRDAKTVQLWVFFLIRN